MTNFRTACGFAFFAALFWLGFVAEGPERIYNALSFGGAVGFVVFAGLTFADLRGYAADEPEVARDRPKEYKMDLEVIEGNQIIKREIPFDELWLRVLLEDMRRGKGAHAAYREGRADYKRWHVDAVLPVLERMGIVAKSQNYSENGKWILTQKGVRVADRLLDASPLPHKDIVKVRI